MPALPSFVSKTVASFFLSCLFQILLCNAQSPEPGNYKSWDYCPTMVFGILKLDNTAHRSYFKISKPDALTIKVQTINASGTIERTAVCRFANGKLNSVIYADQWGNTYQVTKFVATAPAEFMVTRKYYGKNDYLPCKGVKYIYKDNLLSELRYISYNNTVCPNANGVAIIKYKRYDDKNRFALLKEMSFYDAAGKPMINSSYDCHKVLYEYNEKGNQTSIAYYGTGNEPLTSRYGVFKYKYQYNDDDNLTVSETIGLNEEAVNNSYGVSRTVNEYNDAGLTNKQTRYNNKNVVAKASSSGDGIAIIKYEYDDNGNETKISYFDENNNPMNNNSGYHMISYKYSSQNMLADEEYFDRNQAAVNDNYGIHHYSYLKDDKGRTIREAYYDEKGEPVKDKQDEVYMVKYKFDDNSREISRSYWKDNDSKMARWNGYHEQLTKYNEEGQVTEADYLDENGNAFRSSSGYSRMQMVFNPDARIAERKFFDGTDPITVTNSFAQEYHSIKYYYDNTGRISFLRYFDTSNQPTVATISFDENINVHKIEFIYQGNRIIQEKFYLLNNDSPSKVIDCLSHDYVNTNGINKGFKNQ